MEPHRENEEGIVMSNWWEEQQAKARKSLMEYRAGRIPYSKYQTSILQWGKAGLLEARPDIEPFLNSPNANLRGQALQTLVRLGLQEFWSTAVRFFLYDPDYGVRIEGANALGCLKKNTQDRRTLGILASVVSDIYEEDSIRSTAYYNMRVVTYGKQRPTGPSSNPFFVGRDFDWDFVRSNLDSTLDEEWKEEAQDVLAQYRSGTLPEQEHYALLRKIGRAHLQEAQKDVEYFLQSPEKILRTTAFDVLILYLQIPNNWQIAVDMLEHDPDDDKRMMAANVLGRLMQGTNDVKTLRILEQFYFDKDEGVAMSAVEACERIYTGDDLSAFLLSIQE
jgi:HEAT repeat protein